MFLVTEPLTALTLITLSVEFERAFFNNSTNLCTDMEKAAIEATEGATEALSTSLQNYVNKICNEAYNLPDENIPE